MIGLGIAIAIVVILVWSGFFIVEQQTTAVVERFGKYVRTARAGLNFKIPLIEQLGGRLSMRVRQLDVPVETKTQDNVFVRVSVSVQFHVVVESIFEAFYKLDNPEQQITSFVFDVVRARVPKMKLDDLFEKKDEIADAVRIELSDIMGGFGYGIVKALVTDIDPDKKVKAAMNEINEAQRLRVAANERGEAEKILKVKQAEAEAQSNALQGKGIADQRKAIVDGLKESIDGFQKTVVGTDAHEVMNLVLLTQYFDTLKSIGTGEGTNTIMLPHSPSGLQDMAEQMRSAMISANAVNGK
jgi:regulator of protease activity HflC (stomatin/prohibitin superfamily)